MNLTSRSRYALKIMMDFGTVPQGQLVRRQDIVRRQGIPSKYLDQLMTLLRRNGLIESIRGREGGYYLTRPAAEVSVWDIFLAVEVGLYPVICLDHEQSCAYEASCVTSDPWKVIFDTVQKPLSQLSLFDLCYRFADEKKMCPIGGIRECPPKAASAEALVQSELQGSPCGKA